MAGLLGSGARVRVAAWGCAGCRYRGVTALATLSQAVEAVHARSALARCLVPGRSCSPASNAGSVASSASLSAYRAKVPGQDVLRTAIRGRGHVLRSRPRAAALRRARPPRRREGLFLCVEREERCIPLLLYGTLTHAQLTLRPPPDTLRQGYALETCRSSTEPPTLPLS